jgi:hypothetical protein
VVLAWWRRGAAAANLASNRPDLWLPGALVSLLFLGWLPFVLVVVRLPGPGDLPFLAASLTGSPLFPWNLVGLLALVSVAVLLGFVLVAVGEAALLARGGGRGLAGRRPAAAVARMAAVLLLAALPAVAAGVMLGVQIAVVAPAEFQSPDIGGGPMLRTLLAVAPFVAVIGVAAYVGQLIGAPALRRVAGTPGAGSGGESIGHAVAGAMGDLARGAPRLAATAAVTLLVHLTWTVAVFGLLTVLWRPIAAGLAAGLSFDLVIPALLLGFVAIWICLVVGGGALHAWASVWWSSELAAGVAPPQREVESSPVPT